MSKLVNYNNKTGYIITFENGLGSVDQVMFSAQLENEINKIGGYCEIVQIDGFLFVGKSMEQSIECIKENINEIKKIKNNNIVIIFNVNNNIGIFNNGININNLFGFSFEDWKHICITPNMALEDRSYYTKHNINELKELFNMYMGYTMYNVLTLNEDNINYVNLKTLPFSEKPTLGIVITSIEYEPIYFVNSLSDIYKTIYNNRKKNLLNAYAVKGVREEKLKAIQYLEFLEKYYSKDNIVSKHKISYQDNYNYNYDEDENDENIEIVSFIKSPLEICKTLHLNSMKPLATKYEQVSVFTSIGATVKDNIESVRIRHKRYSKYLEQNLQIHVQIDDIMRQIEFEI